MPEGHTVHRTANTFAELFGGQQIFIDSPQGRFSAGANLISGQELKRSRAIGKQLFLEFRNGLTLRIHLGIYGKWNWRKNIDVKSFLNQPVVGEVRARFYTSSAVAELRGPTVCEILSKEEVRAVENRLGPDPLNPDSFKTEPEGEQYVRFLNKVSKSNKSIGLLLMDQTVISGIGNVYRAEILFRAGIDPYTPGNRLSREQVHSLWKDSVALLKIGVKTGYMITRQELFKKNPGKAERNFVYKRENLPCRVCENNISIAIEAGRKLYWCPNCQR